MTPSESNQHAYALAGQILNVIETYHRDHPETNLGIALGATNITMASLVVNAPGKEQALRTLDANVDMIRHIINDTPDTMFGGPINLN